MIGIEYYPKFAEVTNHRVTNHIHTYRLQSDGEGVKQELDMFIYGC